MKISKKSIVIFSMLLVMMPPNALGRIGIIKNVFNVFQVFFVIFLGIRLIKEKHYSPVFILSSMFALIVLISSCIKGGNVYEGMVYFLNLVGFLLLLEYIFSNDFCVAIGKMYKYYFVLCLFNYVYLIISHYFLGKAADNSLFITVSNSISPVLIFSVVLAVINDRYNNKGKISISSLFLFISLIHTELLVWSGTGLIGFFIVMIFTFFCYREKSIKISFMTLVIISIVIFVSIVFLRLQEVFSYLIVNILGKDLTFTGRTVIWDYYINEIKNSWVIGYGVGYNPYKGLFAHNGFLDLMIKGGIIGLICMGSLFIVLNTKFKKNCMLVSSNLIAISIFSYLIMMITEMPSISYLIGFFMIEWYMKGETPRCLD